MLPSHSQQKLRVLRKQLPVIESVMKCIEMNWMAIIVSSVISKRAYFLIQNKNLGLLESASFNTCKVRIQLLYLFNEMHFSSVWLRFFSTQKLLSFCENLDENCRKPIYKFIFVSILCMTFVSVRLGQKQVVRHASLKQLLN